MEGASVQTIPSVLAAGGYLQHSLVRVELTNGIVLTGRVLQLDAATMNMKLDAVTDTAVCRRRCGEEGGTVEWETDPAALRCTSSVVLRGCHVRYIDFVDEEAGGGGGGRGLQELTAAVRAVRPALV
ncbi:putative small nuclear ribonucleoprotein [Trypanosoma conorhini]|uniref:Putative small nuclear ribonucleoprotein n=1 Tax=Trypanosoma conorhini TaxID=83891 RepID=A0A422QBW6_9TRYP|nr:putative small nuclear ribonucleoprotein [Trypanosoma conorhini]RNF27483.1 putative small nuclear ribonucleoprotein [Trypanosoma conorhini]